jgi:hypothetical protein
LAELAPSLPLNALFAVKTAEGIIHLLGCQGKAWIEPCGTDPNYHTFNVPHTGTNTDTGTVQVKRPKDSHGDVGDGTEKAERIFEMMCYGLLVGIPLTKKGSNGGYTLQCSTCKANLFKATAVRIFSRAETNDHTDTTPMFSFQYCKHEDEEKCLSDRMNWMDDTAHKLLALTPAFCTALAGALAILRPQVFLPKPSGNKLGAPFDLTKLSELGFHFGFEKLRNGYNRFLTDVKPKLDENQMDNTSTASNEQIMLTIFKDIFKKKSDDNSDAAKKKGAQLNASGNVLGGTGLDASVQTGKRKRPPISIIT